MKKKMLAMIVLIVSLLAVGAGAAAQETKKLYFEETDGTMTWNPVRGSDGNWFMSFTNMIPGGRYEDDLKIENGSGKTWKMYMQAIPLEQEEIQDELLERIYMSVVLDGNVLYSGTASGMEYENGALQDVIYLGTYEAGEESQITVQLKLDQSLGIENSDRLTRSDWKFMVTEVKQTSEKTTPQVIQPPKTGDTTNLALYQILLAVSLFFIIVSAIYRVKTAI